MTLTWYGHSCFMLDSPWGTAVFDPYEPDSVPGLKLPPLCANVLLSSHRHFDHFCAAAVSESGREHRLEVEGFPCFHDDQKGALRGENVIFAVQAGDTRFVHLGDLGHELTPEQYGLIGRVDVLMLPVGGVFTVDAEAAAKVAAALHPKVIIPMHYRSGEKGLPPLDELDRFTKLFDPEKILRTDSNVWEVNAGLEDMLVIPAWP